MQKRNNYISKFTYNILENFPSWMKIHNEKSVGFPIINFFGIELERIDEQFKENFNDLFIKSSNPSQIYELYFINKDKYINATEIFASGNNELIPIKVVSTDYDFYNNRPTRIHELQDHIFTSIVSGSMSGFYGINYFYNLISGTYYTITGLAPINPSSIIIFDDNFNETNRITLASGRMDYDNQGFYEILIPDNSGILIDKYPLYRNVETKDPAGHIIAFENIDHWTPESASGYENKWYYNEDGDIKYHFTRLNNPFGSGIYYLSSGITSKIPVEGTIKIYDILNLDSSGNPVEIVSSGTNVYEYTSPSGDFNYIGYEQYVPPINEGYAGATGTLKFVTSWFQGRSSGWLDDNIPPHSGTFQYIQGTGDLNNDIWFYNAISKYLVEYDYIKYPKLKDLTTTNRYNHNIDLLPANLLTLTEKYNYEGNLIPWEISSTSISGIKIDPDYVRPGVPIDISITLNETNKSYWNNPSGSAFSMNLYRNNLGYTQEIFDKNYINII